MFSKKGIYLTMFNNRFVFAMLLSCLFLVGCGSRTVVVTGDSTMEEMEQTEKNQAKLAKATPPPQFDYSLERENLVRKLKTWNVRNKVSYIYLLSNDGNVIANYVVHGKVSSLNSFLTTPQQVVSIPNRALQGYTQHVLPSPDFDGSYGDNPKGIFFFTTSEAYVEWTGQYLLSDQPLKITSPIKLLTTVDLEKQGK